ncbi:MAG: hypothetical protein JNM95_06780 [Chitinophagaceae bacterium]|nr:hypothetical protein [Chitinophagaceae bacterium]
MNKKLFLVVLPVILFVVYVTFSSSSTGINGQSVAGCSCHNATASPNTLVSITGLPAGGYTNGTVYPITISVTNNVITPFSGGFGLRDGFDLTSTSGSFTAITGTALNGATEIRHNTPKAVVSGTASWTFNWTAPTTGSNNVTFNLAGNATNGSGDTNGDQWDTTVVTIIKSGTPLTVTATNTTIACNNGTSTVTANGIGGQPSYQYKLNAGSYQNSNVFTNTLAGSYTVTIKDALSNTATTSLSISQPPALNLSLASGTIVCNGGLTSITATASGGTGSKVYRLNTGSFVASNVFNNNAAGTYTVTVRDANLCTKSATILVSQPTVLSFGSPTVTPVSCNNGDNGAISITASGGNATKTYTINPLGPQSNNLGQFTSLTPNTYTITVTDGLGCTKTTSITLTNPAAVSVSAADVTGCMGTPIALQGSPAGGTFSLPSPYNGPSATYTYTYTTGLGCVITSLPAFVEKKEMLLDPIVSNDILVCNGGSVALAASLQNQNCFAGNFYNGINLEHITNVNFAGINNTSLADGVGYHDYTAHVGNVTAGSTYTITLTEGSYFLGDHWGVWIDYNDDGVFSDFKEYTYIPSAGTVTTSPIKIPSSVSNGIHKMRVRLIWNTPMSPCGVSNWGEIEDYSVQVTGGSNASTALSYLWSNNLNSTLSTPLLPSTVATGIQSTENYQVQITSPEGCVGTASKGIGVLPIQVLDSANATPPQVCPGGSTTLTAYPTIPSNQNCIPSVGFMNCSNLEYISQVSIGTINNITTCDLIDYKDYTTQSTSLAAGNSYAITLGNGNFYLGDTWSVFIDFNHNGILNDVGEYYYFTPNAAIFSKTISVPSSAFNGPTRMRVRLMSNSPCGPSTWGEIEDYTIVITGGVTPQPAISYAWSNNLNSTLVASNNPVAVASNITANENYQVLATTVNGCSQTLLVPVIVNCGYNLSLKLFLQGYYDASSDAMLPVLLNQGEGFSTTITDTVLVELRSSSNTSIVLESTQGLLQTNGIVTCTFASAPSQPFYVLVKHRNGLETWSDQVLNTSTSSYDFSTAATKAYGGNQVELEPGVYGFYSGDANQDQAIDVFDYIIIEPDIIAGNSGYLVSDFNGDGSVDVFDYIVVEPNIVAGISASAP